MKLSVVIPARNERHSIGGCLEQVAAVLEGARDIPYEIVVVDDDSTDETAAIALDAARRFPAIRMVHRPSPPGFGRAVRAGLEAATGDVVAVFMADLSDEPSDLIAYYRKIQEGYDCVFGSRFIEGSSMTSYPPLKLALNRVGNSAVRLLFHTEHNDLTNAFKAYRTRVLEECGPFEGDHFELTLELSLSALLGGYSIARIPIHWSGRTGGISKLRMWAMCGRYLGMLARMYWRRGSVPRRGAAAVPAAAAMEGRLFDERRRAPSSASDPWRSPRMR